MNFLYQAKSQRLTKIKFGASVMLSYLITQCCWIILLPYISTKIASTHQGQWFFNKCFLDCSYEQFRCAFVQTELYFFIFFKLIVIIIVVFFFFKLKNCYWSRLLLFFKLKFVFVIGVVVFCARDLDVMTPTYIWTKPFRD